MSESTIPQACAFANIPCLNFSDCGDCPEFPKNKENK